MKVRNKKTGEVIEIGDYGVGIDYGSQLHYYRTIAEFIEEWEDYKPKEPHIGDGLERKLVRDWAFTYAITTVWVQRVKDSCLIKLMDSDESRRSIVIDSYATIADGHYTIAELCGEEEE